jgi:predicted RNase H-like HicB family nuclease
LTYSVTLEHGSDGSYLAWVHELPGCFARGASREEVKEQLPTAIRAFLDWLRAAGEEVEDDEGSVTVVEEVESAIDSSEDTEVLLEPDREPLTQADWETIERWLSHSRRDLIEWLGRGASSRSPRAKRARCESCSFTIAFVELMYSAWTFDVHDREGLRDFLDWTRVITRARMRALAVRDDGSVTQAEWAGAQRPEPWTARKAARRLLWHERNHTPGEC